MFKIKGNAILFKGKYGYMRIIQVYPEYFVYGSGSLEEVNNIKESTYLHLCRLIKKYKISL
ncbi:MAG: hypothetical protein KKH98_11645 [Spirochaetes bacterium]|nr:hypothetical protein [Spirochaetota bacterium]